MATAGTPKLMGKCDGKKKRVVRVYITSYTDEFHAERDLIKNQVLTELRRWCESKQLTLKEQFVKWGSQCPGRRDVDEQERIQTSIENCYVSNVMPIFLNFSCESVGWIPMWDDYPDDYVEDFIEKYGLLVEDLEVMRGAYREDNYNSLYLLRQDGFLENISPAEQNYFLQKSAVADKIKTYGDKISQKFSANRILKYPVQYGGMDERMRPKIKFSDGLKQLILDFCTQRILFDVFGEQPRLSVSDDLSTGQAHQTFMKNKSACVVGRSDMIDKIENYILREDKDVPLLILGGSGYGKSSIICKAAEIINSKVQQGQFACPGGQTWNVFFHFVGAVPGSTNLEAMLKRLLAEADILNDSNIPRGIESTAQMCFSLLSNPNTRPMILFVDALNQFADEQAARVMSWLPRKLAPQVRCIFSTIEDSPQHKVLLSRETKPIELFVPPLDMNSRKSIVQDFLKKYDKTITESQMTMLLGKESSSNPMWLSVACEEIQLIQGKLDVDNKIKELPDGLLNLLECLLMRFEADFKDEQGENLVVATLCLLEASSAGLLETELRQILGNKECLMPPLPFDEKEEKETSEKEISKHCKHLSDKEWSSVFSVLRPFLRPYGDSAEGRLDFYHRALSKAVRKRYFIKKEDDGETEEKSDDYYWWHKKLADYFEHVENMDRYVEEYLNQLVSLDDCYRLSRCLCDWIIFDQLYHEEYSSKLLAYWRKIGPATEMISSYEKALKGFEEDESANEEAISMKYERVCRVVIQAGKYHEALELLKTALKIEEKELGARPHRMVELYALMAEIYDEKLKLNDFVNPSQLPDLKMTVHYGRKSIAIRKSLPGTYHKFKLAMSLMRLAFNMESWEACGGSPELSGALAVAEGNKYIDKAIKIFEELNDTEHYAEAWMTKGVLAPRGSMEQLKCYNKAKDLCMHMYGENHILTSRLYINIGILYEDNNNFHKAYEYFKKWARVSEEILGPAHPKTVRAKGVLREARYRQIAQSLGETEQSGEDVGAAPSSTSAEASGTPENLAVGNLDLEHYFEDVLNEEGGVNLDIRSSSSSSSGQVIEANVEVNDNEFHSGTEISFRENRNDTLDNSNVCYDDDSNGDDSEVLMNGYDSRLSDREESDSDHENSDNEHIYDDNFDAYDEQYILHTDSGPVIDEFNVNLDDEEEDEEIVLITERENLSNELERDNRYLLRQPDNRYEDDREEHENSDSEIDFPRNRIIDSNRLTDERT